MPVGSRLVLNTARTDVHADGLLGDCALNIASGLVRLGHAAALRANLAAGSVEVGHVTGDARSDIELVGASGAFDIDRAEGRVTARAGDCPIRIGRAKLANASGGIEIGVSEGTAASVDARSTKGAVRDSLSTRDSDIVIHGVAA